MTQALDPLPPPGAASAVNELKTVLSHFSHQHVGSKNTLDVEELLSVDGEEVTEAEWTDEDIAEQTRVDVIEEAGGVVDVLEEPSNEEPPMLSLPEAC